MLSVRSPSKNGLLLAGIPFAQGAIKGGNLPSLWSGERELPSWAAPRSHWSDGSVRWAWVHARVPEGEARLEARSISSVTNATGFGSSFIEIGKTRFEATKDGTLIFSNGSHSCRVREASMHTGLGRSVASRLENFKILEPSPVAPLARLRFASVNSFSTVEYLVRLDPELAMLTLTRRITFLGTDKRLLRGMGLEVEFDGAPGWSAADSPSSREVDFRIPSPDRAELNGKPIPPHPESLFSNDAAAIYVPKGWQRAPLAIHASGEKIAIEFYPESASPLRVWPGTSFRHTVRIAFGAEAARRVSSEVQWALDPGYAAATGVFGPLAPSDGTTRRWFSGYDVALRQGTDGARKRSLDKVLRGPMGESAPLEDEAGQATEYFGLIHYGDWPLELGRYARPSLHHRVYANNEHDVPLVFFQQFIRTGQWKYLDVAREGAVHMADVDMDAVTGGMRFHGYDINGEDHCEHRAGVASDHTWTDSLWLQHFLLGDPWAREVAERLTQFVLDELAGDTDEDMLRAWLKASRALGWPLQILCAQVEATGDTRSLAKARQIVGYLDRFTSDPDRALEEDTICRGCGNWVSHEHGDGISYEKGDSIRWMGTAMGDGAQAFMVGICLEALARYHQLTRDPTAVPPMDRMSRFLVESMWRPYSGRFDYMHNPFLREARVLDEPGGMMAVWGLAYTYELTGNPIYRQVAMQAFYGYLWMMTNPRAARDLAEIARTAGAVVQLLDKWRREDEEQRATSVPLSTGQGFTFDGQPQDLLKEPRVKLKKGEPEFKNDGGLISRQRSFLDLQLDPPAPTTHGRISFELTPSWVGKSDEALAQRAWLHLSDEPFTASSVSVVSYYSQMSVRFYDPYRRLIDSLDYGIADWQPGQKHHIDVTWDTTKATLVVDRQRCAELPLSRKLGGVFRRLCVGYRPGNWKADGVVSRLRIALGCSAPHSLTPGRKDGLQ